MKSRVQMGIKPQSRPQMSRRQAAALSAFRSAVVEMSTVDILRLLDRLEGRGLIKKGKTRRDDDDLVVRESGAASARNEFELLVGSARLVGKVPGTGTWYDLVQRDFGSLDLQPGVHRIVLRPAGQLRGALLDLRTIRFAPD